MCETIKIIGDQAAKTKLLLFLLSQKNQYFSGEKLRIKQIFINILPNAIKFSNEYQEVTITIIISNGVIVYIQDHGIGIAENDIPKILEKFGIVKNSFLRQSEGTGIGLWLTKVLLEAHNGTLEIESEIGIGTKVTIFSLKLQSAIKSGTS